MHSKTLEPPITEDDNEFFKQFSDEYGVAFGQSGVKKMFTE